MRLIPQLRDWRYFCFFLLMVGALFWGGAQPGAGKLFPPHWDKLAHALTFFVMTLLLGRGVRWSLPGMALIVLAVGAGDEWHQRYLPGRVASKWDLLADAVGILVALLVLRCCRGRAAGKP